MTNACRYICTSDNSSRVSFSFLSGGKISYIRSMLRSRTLNRLHTPCSRYSFARGLIRFVDISVWFLSTSFRRSRGGGGGAAPGGGGGAAGGGARGPVM